MNAIKFIQQHGIEKAREVVEGAPSNAESYQDGYYFRTKPEFQFHNGFHPVWNLTDNDGEWFKKKGFSPVANDDLKRLVESVDYVLIHGHEKSKEILKNAPVGAECYSWSIGNSGARDKTVELVKLKQAVADYESLFSNDMGDDSHIENHVSPLCKMGEK